MTLVAMARGYRGCDGKHQFPPLPTSVAVPAKFSRGTSQHPSLPSPAFGRGISVRTCWTLSAWSSLMHGGKSAPKDTSWILEGPISGFGWLVCVTVTLPRNVLDSEKIAKCHLF